ncbi:hypothetical protein [Glycomyces sp. NRRL B-16210]|uniref:hypothetical protein n=1 Tax=Glycomyces sp. NRRL B-16210 TaxID=1463821 RepID=UPI0004C1A41A|nr:hypothetical protein [Glycomyces sp. NRRL B-16210]
MRALLIALTVALTVFGLSACVLPQVGEVAIGVDDAGGPVLVMASCEGPAEFISLSSTAQEPEGVRESARTDRDWRVDLELTNPAPRNEDPAAVSLTAPDDRWNAVGVIDVVAGDDDGRLYRASAWPTTETNLGSIEFTTADLAEIGEGEVLYYERDDKRIGPVSAFIETGLSTC